MSGEPDPINLTMTPTGVPQIVRDHRPDTTVLNIGPPPGISDEECGTVEALVGRFAGYSAVADYWRPDADQLQILNRGGVIELVQFTPRMIMHSLSVWPAAETDEVDLAEQALAATPLARFTAAAATLVDEYTRSSWTRRVELIEGLRDGLVAYMRSDA